ncbi:MAG: hypothetical protein ACTSUK_07960 [Promethearchaeota archaeon]
MLPAVLKKENLQIGDKPVWLKAIEVETEPVFTKSVKIKML